MSRRPPAEVALLRLLFASVDDYEDLWDGMPRPEKVRLPGDTEPPARI